MWKTDSWGFSTQTVPFPGRWDVGQSDGHSLSSQLHSLHWNTGTHQQQLCHRDVSNKRITRSLNEIISERNANDNIIHIKLHITKYYFHTQGAWSLQKVIMPWYAASAAAKMCGGLSARSTPWYSLENCKKTHHIRISIPFFLYRGIQRNYDTQWHCCHKLTCSE